MHVSKMTVLQHLQFSLPKAEKTQTRIKDENTTLGLWELHSSLLAGFCLMFHSVPRIQYKKQTEFSPWLISFLLKHFPLFTNVLRLPKHISCQLSGWVRS